MNQKNMIRRILTVCLFAVVSQLFVACAPEHASTIDEFTYREARQAYDNRFYLEAVEGFSEVVEEYSWSSRVDNSYYYLGLSHIEHATSMTYVDSFYHFSEAEKALCEIEEESALFVAAQLQLAKLSALLGFSDSAMVQAQKIIDQWPEGPQVDEALLFMGELFMASGDTILALAQYDSVIAVYSASNSCDDALYARAEYHKDIDEDSVAQTLYTRIVTECAGSSRGDNAALRLGNYDRKEWGNLSNDSLLDSAEIYRSAAIDWYTLVVTEYPLSGSALDAHYYLGSFAFDRRGEEENEERAIEHFVAHCDLTRDTTLTRYRDVKAKLLSMGVVYEK